VRVSLKCGGRRFEGRRIQGLEKNFLRYYDEKFELWYIIYWDEALKCYVTKLESGQRPVLEVKE
jgi:hypothetical protein